MKILLALILVLLPLQASEAGTRRPNVLPTASALTFRYTTFDAGSDYACKHFLQDADTQDWDVQCFDTKGIVKKHYTVHLWISLYNHPTPPQTSLEILYWLTDLSVPNAAQGSGATTWVNLNPRLDASAINGLQLSQSVDSDTAGLYLTIQN